MELEFYDDLENYKQNFFFGNFMMSTMHVVSLIHFGLFCKPEFRQVF